MLTSFHKRLMLWLEDIVYVKYFPVFKEHGQQNFSHMSVVVILVLLRHMPYSLVLCIIEFIVNSYSYYG